MYKRQAECNVIHIEQTWLAVNIELQAALLNARKLSQWAERLELSNHFLHFNLQPFQLIFIKLLLIYYIRTLLTSLSPLMTSDGEILKRFLQFPIRNQLFEGADQNLWHIVAETLRSRPR